MEIFTTCPPSLEDNTMTRWSGREELIRSGYGVITCLDWCKAEMRRINASGGSVQIVTRANGEIALARVEV